MSSVPLNEKVARLVQFINELSQLKQKPVSSYKKYEETLWVSKLPKEPECLDAFRDNTEDWLYVKKPFHPTSPNVPKDIKDWLSIDFRKYSFNIHKSITKEVLENE